MTVEGALQKLFIKKPFEGAFQKLFIKKAFEKPLSLLTLT